MEVKITKISNIIILLDAQYRDRAEVKLGGGVRRLLSPLPLQ